MALFLEKTLSDVNSFSQDVIDKLAPFINKSKQLSHVTEYDAALFFNSMLDGLYVVAELMARVQITLQNLEIEKKRTEAVSRIDEFPVWAGERNIVKATEGDKEAFNNINPKIIGLKKEIVYWDTMREYIISIRSNLISAQDSVKKVLYAKSLNSTNIKITD